MDEQPVQQPDENPDNAPVETPAPEQPDVNPEQQGEVPEAPGDAPAPDAPADALGSDDEDDEYLNYQIPNSQLLDFSNLPVGDDNLIDPNALAGTINQSIAAAEERATMRAQRAYAEQRAEEKSWEKAYEKHPELKNNKELRDYVHNARLGEVANLLSRNQDPSTIKMPSPGQVADRLFKYIETATANGMKQANENTVIQQSAHLETAGSRGSDSSDSRAKAYQNINNTNKEVARQARQDLLKSMLYGDQ